MIEDNPTSENVRLDELRQAFSSYLGDEQYDRINDLLDTMHPAEIAALITGMSGLERNLLFDLCPEDKQHEVLVGLEESDQEQLLKRLDHDRIAEILEHLESDDATDIAALLDEPTREQVLKATPQEDREEVEHLLEYDEDSAGGLMAVELITITDDKKVNHAVDIVRTGKETEEEEFHYIYVVSSDGKLKGRISMIDLVLAERDQPVMDILDEDMVVVKEETDQEEVANIFKRYDLISAPVVNSEGVLIGRITIDDIVDVIEEEAEEDIGYLAGTGEEEVTERNLLISARSRLPWLVVAFAGELVAAFLLRHFENEFSTKDAIIIICFIPVIIAVAGNIGIQSSTIVVRGLATGEIPAHKAFSRVGREVIVSSFNGIILSFLLIGVVVVWEGKWIDALALGLSLLAVVITAALVGTATPFVLRKLNQDPALASGPFITMTNDVVGLTIYLVITTSILLNGK